MQTETFSALCSHARQRFINGTRVVKQWVILIVFGVFFFRKTNKHNFVCLLCAIDHSFVMIREWRKSLYQTGILPIDQPKASNSLSYLLLSDATSWLMYKCDNWCSPIHRPFRNHHIHPMEWVSLEHCLIPSISWRHRNSISLPSVSLRLSAITRMACQHEIECLGGWPDQIYQF